MVKVPPVPSSLAGTFLVSSGAALDFLLLPVELSGTSSMGAQHSEEVRLPECFAGKKSKAASPATKKVHAREDGTEGTFTIGATLDSK